MIIYLPYAQAVQCDHGRRLSESCLRCDARMFWREHGKPACLFSLIALPFWWLIFTWWMS